MSEQMKWGIIHTMDCSTIKRNNVLIHAKTWVNLKNISLKEKKPLTKYLKLHAWFHLYEISRTETESRLVVAGI